VAHKFSGVPKYCCGVSLAISKCVVHEFN
jgi:hypothetical protein